MPNSWNRTARGLHWAMAALIVIGVPAGYVMTRTYLAVIKGGPDAALHIRASQVHHTVGLILLALALHVGAALVHHFVRRDAVLRAMLGKAE